ncbi:hypothetical protein [Bacillus xiapuensis]|uniref:hypothetical protein n=1 Tax=Bacillus xiapuensis TaxID=2014075 RepID=UPI000C230C00|nr:hypothetical protein [Bacillus xiapuensis]
MTDNQERKDLMEQRKRTPNEECTQFVDKKIVVEAFVTVQPRVYMSDPEIECCKPQERQELPHTKKHHHKKKAAEKSQCKFVVEQELCLRIPLHFDAEVEIDQQGILCRIDADHREDKSQTDNR